MIPTRVVNTLNLGRAMAARIDTGQPGFTAWIFVCGTVDRARTWDSIREAWTLAQPTRQKTGS
jgi:hypothetical protein